ncbi:OmpH family outer membrane protein [Reinekea blandensis]|uniref:Outer membrane protein n=1 Tax=Reinekea blandensis MED297 TaxID=314283 RepID=A4BCG5_9GAMM|nr:OmpH family outer membrane protein [Reinekea blandensis]EAR10231.1 hypothetical protein MED297_13447 [Reinekea sp. MED297] [Reinekea blandensis MED297]
MFNRAIAILTLTAGLALSAGTVQAETDIVVMNYQAVLFNSAAAADAQTSLNEVLRPGQDQLNDIAQQIQTRQSRLETDKDILTEAEVQTFQQELQVLAANQAQLSNRIQQVQQQKQQEFIEQYRPAIREVVSAYVEANGVSLVIDSQAVLWNEDVPDITETVMAAFDEWYESQAESNSPTE